MQLHFSTSLWLCLGSLLFIVPPSMSQFLEQPRLRWTFDLDNSASLRQGNAIVPWRGGDKLFITASDGSLHILDLNSDEASTFAVFKPSPIGSASTECSSSVLVVDRAASPPQGPPNEVSTATESDAYLVYAVVDVSGNTPDETGTTTASSSSRIFAVNFDGSERWSLLVDGSVQGTPVIGSDGRTFYISRNVGNSGLISVIQTNAAGDSATVVASMSLEGRNAPFSPPALGSANVGNFQGDFVVVAESWDDGFGQQGSLHVMIPSASHQELGGIGNESYEFRLVSATAWPYSAIMAPFVQGTNVFMGGTASVIAGFSDNGDITEVLRGRRDEVFPRWQIQIQPSLDNVTTPLSVTPALSIDGSVLCQPGVSNFMFCLESDRGREAFTLSTESLVLSKPVFTEVNGVGFMYFIESANGRVRQVDAFEGDQFWEFSCSEVNGVDGCQDSVEADFSVAPGGNALYYGDINGRIVALEIAEFLTESPTAEPSESPTAMPTEIPTISISPSLAPSEGPTAAPSVFTAATDRPTMRTTDTAVEMSPTERPAQTVDPAIFDSLDQVNAANDQNGDSDGSNLSLGALLGAAAAGLFVLVVLALFAANTFFTPKKKKRSKETTRAVISTAVAKDLEEGSSGSSDDGKMDAVLVNSSSGDSMEVEVTAGTHLCGTPKSKARKSRQRKSIARTPPTPATLESIVEDDDEEVFDFDDDTKKDLDEQFVNVEMNENDQDDGTVDSDASLPPPPPPLAADEGQSHNRYPPTTQETDEITPAPMVAEEKKDEEESDIRPISPLPDTRPVSPQPSLGLSPQPSLGLSPQPSVGMPDDAPESPARSVASQAQSLFSAFAAVLGPSQSQDSATNQEVTSPERSHATSLSGRMSPGGLSTDSSLYTDEKSGIGGTKMSPLSPHLLSKTLDEEQLPEDELMGTPSHLMLQPTLDHLSEERDFYTEEAPDDERIRAPGAHYMTASSNLRPKFTPSTVPSTSGVKSVRTKKNLNGFAPSAVDEIGAKKTPSFKRRNRKEEATADTSGDDTWSSFLKDLAAAEQQFFSPTHSQKSAVLRYHDEADDADDEFSGFGHNDADTVER